MTQAFMPKPYAVFVTVSPNGKNGLKEPFTGRVGPAASVADAKKLIEEDKLAMRDTIGGLLPAMSIKNREYHIFKANWERVDGKKR